MKRLIPAALIAILALLAVQRADSRTQASSKATAAEEVAAVTYEHLATAIIEIEATEDNLVKSILIGYHQAAQRHLRRAVDDAANRQTHLEAAATEITNIANGGGKGTSLKFTVGAGTKNQ